MILVIAEHRAGRLNRASLEALAAAQQLAQGAEIRVLVAGAAPDAIAAELTTCGVTEVLVADDPALEPYTADAFVQALQGVLGVESPGVVLLPHTYQTRDFAPALAARLRTALVTDVTGLSGTTEAPVFHRPAFQGKLVAHVRPAPQSPGTPVLVSVQIGAWRADAVAAGPAAPVRRVAVTIDPARVRQRPEAPFQEAKQAVDLGQAERIVAVGRGIKSQEHMALIERLASALGAEVAASRPICDSGWLPMERQIGSSGQTVAPKLYVAIGISGAIQHLVGMKGSRTIVAVNKDADAPIFEVADYGIVGDLFEVVPALITALGKG